MKGGLYMRRKNDFHKAIRKMKLCEAIYHDSKYFLKGILGKFDKGKIHEHDDSRKTNSEWHGKHNYKPSDKRRYDSTEYSLREGGDE